MRISDWSSDVCSSDLVQSPSRSVTTVAGIASKTCPAMRNGAASGSGSLCSSSSTGTVHALLEDVRLGGRLRAQPAGHRSVVRAEADHVVGEADPEQEQAGQRQQQRPQLGQAPRSEEPTSELQSLITISYA